MPQPPNHQLLTPEELAQAVADLTRCLSSSQARFSISGGAASLLIRMQHSVTLRSTNDIDLVVQPTANVTAESISAWLLSQYPNAFVAKMAYGVATLALAFRRSDGSIEYIEVEIFDVSAWPGRPQYNLDEPDNDITLVHVNGVDIPVFSTRWLLREKIVTAFGRQGSEKERTDLDDASALLEIIEPNSLDLTNYDEAVRHFLTKMPEARQLLELKVRCPSVMGEPWTWNGSAEVYWRLEGDKLQYVDAKFEQHEFNWEPKAKVWYLTSGEQKWVYNAEVGDIALWT